MLGRLRRRDDQREREVAVSGCHFTVGDFETTGSSPVPTTA